MKILNKLVSIAAIGFFGFFICHYVSYLNRYYDPSPYISICFGIAIWKAYFNIVLSIIATLIGFFLFNNKVHLAKAFISFIIIGVLMFALGIGLI